MQVLQGKGQQQKEESSSRKQGSQKEQLRNGNSKSASSQKGFGASLQTGKPDGFLFTFREKLFIYAQKGIQASFLTNDDDKAYICLGREVSDESLTLEESKNISSNLYAKNPFKHDILYTAIYTSKNRLFALRGMTNDNKKNNGSGKKIYKRSKNKRIDQKGKAKHGVIENKNNVPNVVDWSNARNTRPYIFDSFDYVNDSPDNPHFGVRT